MSGSESRDFTSVEFRDLRNRVVAELDLAAATPGTLLVLPPEDALAHGEEAIQLLEGHAYEYRLRSRADGCHLQPSNLVLASRLDPCAGRIETRIAVGALELVLLDGSQIPVSRATVEIRSTKVGYRTEYRQMLDDIASRVIGLLGNIHAPTQTRLRSVNTNDRMPPHFQIAFLRSILNATELWESLARIEAQPHLRWEPQHEDRDIRRGIKPSGTISRSIARGMVRSALPTTHPLHSRMLEVGIRYPSAPKTVPGSRAVPTVDTAENRFVKHALTEFEAYLVGLEHHLSGTAGRDEARLRDEVSQLRKPLSRALASTFFSSISDATRMSLDSPVLQRKAGYREILQTWVRFKLAASLAWDGRDDEFRVGIRNIATLYEYWLFFKLLDIAIEVFGLDAPPKRQLVEWSRDRLDFKLRSGSALEFHGSTTRNGRELKLRFSYNRTFPGSTVGTVSYPKPGSWTQGMRPDFSFSFWPAALSEYEAELAERIVHIHFDAKYRVDRFRDLFGPDDVRVLDEDDAADRENRRPRRADLLKMHSYRDAIRRTEGAYVIYPGDDGGQMWFGYREIIPGLGAFAVRPGDESTGISQIRQFLLDVIDHLIESQTFESHPTYSATPSPIP